MFFQISRYIQRDISQSCFFRYLAICRPLSPLARSTTGEARRVSALPFFVVFLLLFFHSEWVFYLYFFVFFFSLFYFDPWPPVSFPSLNHHMSYPTAQTNDLSSISQSKHLKGHSAPPVSDVTFFNQRDIPGSLLETWILLTRRTFLAACWWRDVF